MLSIVASYHCLQFQRKLNKLEKMAKKNIFFVPDSGPFGPNLCLQKDFYGFYHNSMLGIRASYPCIRFQGKTNVPNLRKWHKKLVFHQFLKKALYTETNS